jgi:tRNA A-37 threonylcarbamoyl transferase component Bud32
MPADLKKIQASVRTLEIDRRRQAPDIDPRLSVNPSARDAFRALGLTSPEAFLAIPGEIVSGHPDRHVMQITLGNGRVGYLKREHRIRWRERFRNWRAGYGWVCKSVREGQTLQYLESLGFPGPKWLAFGEDGAGRAFLLVEEVANAADLRRLARSLVPLDYLAIRLGRFCAELHDAGFDHPDLYAKHFLIDPASDIITLLDWQRTAIRDWVSWPQRTRALAALLATLPARQAKAIESERAQARFLWAYRRTVRASHKTSVPSFARLARQVRTEAKRLERRRGVREQRQPPLPDASQRLVWLDGDALCAIPAVANDLRWPAVQAALYDPSRNGTELVLTGDRRARLQVATNGYSAGRLWAWLRGKAWRSPELRKARLLFHLERHHVAAPKLLAFGQRLGGMGGAAFLLHEATPADAVPLRSALAEANAEERAALLDSLAEMLGRLHEAGCEAIAIDRFALRGQAIRVVHPDWLLFRKHLSERRRKADRRRCARSMSSYCGLDELEQFIRAAAVSQ